MKFLAYQSAGVGAIKAVESDRWFRVLSGRSGIAADLGSDCSS